MSTKLFISEHSFISFYILFTPLEHLYHTQFFCFQFPVSSCCYGLCWWCFQVAVIDSNKKKRNQQRRWNREISFRIHGIMYGIRNKKNSICKQNGYFINGECAKANECERNWWYKFKCLHIQSVQKCHGNGKKFDLFYVHILHRCDKIHDVQPISIPYFSSRYVCIVYTQIHLRTDRSRCHSGYACVCEHVRALERIWSFILLFWCTF